MTRVLWLPDALRAEGVTVVEHPGWQTRGNATFAPRGVVCHHTAGPARGDAPSLGTCVSGRPDVPGPLCHVVLARSGKAIVVASGRANHAGKGGWRGLAGNTSVWGIEAENTGRGEPWPAGQIDAYHRIVTAMCRGGAGVAPIPVSMVCAHREWAPGRKVDPAGIDMDAFRAAVAARLAGRPSTTTHTTTDPMEDDMTPEDRNLLQSARDEAAAAGLRAQELEGKVDRLLAWATRIEARLGKAG